MTKKEFGTRLREIRYLMGLTQMEFALRCDIQLGYLSDLEMGKKNPTLETLNKIASGTEIPLSHFFEKDALPSLNYDASMNKLIAYALMLTPKDRLHSVEVLKVILERND